MGTKIKDLINRQMAVIGADNYWVGETFRDKIDKLSEMEAVTRPVPAVHTVAELVSHLLEWRKDNIRKLKGQHPRLRSMDAPENWIANSELETKGWEILKLEFYSGVDELCTLLQERDDDFLEQRPAGDRHTYLTILDGLVNHDIYHLGQIAITIKLLRLGNRENA